MVNPTIYVSCIKQFWAFVLIKKSNDAVKLQALIDRKKVIITEDTIRQALRLDDADDIDCLPNEEIFAELARMGYKKPSSMALAIICLATDDLSSHNTKYTSPGLTHKVFANMRRIGKGFLRVKTPLFDAMLVPQQVQEDAAEVEEDKDNEALEIVTLKQRVRKLEKKRRTKHSGLNRGGEIAKLDANEDVTLVDVDAEVEMNTNIQGRMAESQAKAYNLDLEYSKKFLNMQDTDEAEPAEVEEVLEIVIAAKLMTEVVTTAAPITTTAQVPKASSLRKRRGVVIQDPKETATTSIIMHSEDNAVMRYQALKRKPLTEAQARKNIMIYLKNMVGFKMDFFKGMTYIEIRHIFEKHYNYIQAFLEKEEEEVTVQGKRQGENLKQEIAKKQRIDEDTEELKRHLHIVANDDDNVYTEATPLASKMFLLVKKKYPLTHFTLQQMLDNVRLEVEEESEMSLEVLRLVRRQLNEGYVPE
nr:hypothetical protein [Tanacetum cinerariifolium]